MVQPLPNFKKRRFFIPDHHKWIIITNRFYDQLRKVPNWETNHDLDAVEDDARNVREGILGLGARAIDIIELKDVKFVDLTELFQDLLILVINNWKRKERTNIFIYYAGHGGLKLNGFMHAVLNDVTAQKLFNFEKFIRILGMNEGAYVVALLDCCRSLFTPDMMRGN